MVSAQPATEAPEAAGATVLAFRVAGERYGLGLDEIVQVVAMVAVSPLPGAPEVVLGVMNYRGRVIPVLDLRRRLGLVPLGYGTDACLVVARAGSRVVAIVADEVIDVARLDVGKVSALTTVFPGDAAVSGLVALADGLLLIVDLEAFLTVDEARRLDEALDGADA